MLTFGREGFEPTRADPDDIALLRDALRCRNVIRRGFAESASIGAAGACPNGKATSRDRTQYGDELTNMVTFLRRHLSR